MKRIVNLIFPCLVKEFVSYKMSDEIYYIKIGILVSRAALNIISIFCNKRDLFWFEIGYHLSRAGEKVVKIYSKPKQSSIKDRS